MLRNVITASIRNDRLGHRTATHATLRGAFFFCQILRIFRNFRIPYIEQHTQFPAGSIGLTVPLHGDGHMITDFRQMRRALVEITLRIDQKILRGQP